MALCLLDMHHALVADSGSISARFEPRHLQGVLQIPAIRLRTWAVLKWEARVGLQDETLVIIHVNY